MWDEALALIFSTVAKTQGHISKEHAVNSTGALVNKYINTDGKPQPSLSQGSGSGRQEAGPPAMPAPQLLPQSTPSGPPDPRGPTAQATVTRLSCLGFAAHPGPPPEHLRFIVSDESTWEFNRGEDAPALKDAPQPREEWQKHSFCTAPTSPLLPDGAAAAAGLMMACTRTASPEADSRKGADNRDGALSYQANLHRALIWRFPMMV